MTGKDLETNIISLYHEIIFLLLVDYVRFLEDRKLEAELHYNVAVHTT